MQINVTDEEKEILLECIQTAADIYASKAVRNFREEDIEDYTKMREKKMQAWQLYNKILREETKDAER